MYSRPLPHRHPISDFFLGEGAAVHRLSETDNPYPNCPSKLTDKVGRIVRSQLKPFHFQRLFVKLSTVVMRIISKSFEVSARKVTQTFSVPYTYYLSDANYQTDNPSHANHPSLVWKRPFLLQMNRMSRPRSWVWRSRFKLTIGISMRKIILEVEYFIKRMIYQMLKFFERIAFHPEMILRPLFCFEETKKYRFINI